MRAQTIKLCSWKGWCDRGQAPTTGRRLPPSPLRVAKTGKNHLNEEITPLFPTGIGERFSQTISNLGHAALLRRCKLPPINESAELTRGALQLFLYSEAPTCTLYSVHCTLYSRYGKNCCLWWYIVDRKMLTDDLIISSPSHSMDIHQYKVPKSRATLNISNAHDLSTE